MMAASLELVAIRIKNKGAVVIGVIMRPQSRLAVIGSAGGNRLGMERIDIGALQGGKSEMRAALAIGLDVQFFRQADPQRGAGIFLAIAMRDDALPGNVDVA